jgi:hypothetical protein
MNDKHGTFVLILRLYRESRVGSRGHVRWGWCLSLSPRDLGWDFGW